MHWQNEAIGRIAAAVGEKTPPVPAPPFNGEKIDKAPALRRAGPFFIWEPHADQAAAWRPSIYFTMVGDGGRRIAGAWVTR